MGLVATRPGLVKSIASVIDQRLVLDMPFEEGGGTFTKDLSGKGNHGALTGGVSWKLLPSGIWVLDLGGSTGCVIIPASPSLNALGDFTFEAWVNLPALGSDHTFVFCDNDTGNIFQIWRYANKLRVYFNNTAYDSVADVPGGQHLIAAVRKTTTLFHYLDGEQIKETTGVSSAALTSAGYLIGKYVAGTLYTLDGTIALSRIYNQALSITENKNRYNRTKHLFGR